MSCNSSNVGKGSQFNGLLEIGGGVVVDLPDALPCERENQVVPDSSKVMVGSSSPVSYDSQYAVQSRSPTGTITVRRPATELWTGERTKNFEKSRKKLSHTYRLRNLFLTFRHKTSAFFLGLDPYISLMVFL